MPYPGAFLLDAQGVVTEKRFQQSYRERETGAALLEQGFGVRGAAAGARAAAAGSVLTVQAHLDAPGYRLFQRRWLTVELAIEPGWHIYGEPIPEGYTALAIGVEPLEGVAVGEVAGPAPRPLRMAGIDEQFAVYEGAVSFALPLTFNKKVEDVTLALNVRYQACSETDCLPPAALTLALPIAAENLVDLDR